jgi:hypothetical protein
MWTFTLEHVIMRSKVIIGEGHTHKFCIRYFSKPDVNIQHYIYIKKSNTKKKKLIIWNLRAAQDTSKVKLVRRCAT